MAPSGPWATADKDWPAKKPGGLLGAERVGLGKSHAVLHHGVPDLGHGGEVFFGIGSDGYGHGTRLPAIFSYDSTGEGENTSRRYGAPQAEASQP